MKRQLSSLLAISLLLGSLPIAASPAVIAGTENEAKFVEKVKTNIAKLGTGAKVQIKLKDGTKLKGYVSEVKDSGFLLTSDDTGMSKEILYPQVKQAKGNNSKTSQRILVVASVVGLLILLAWGAARGN